MWCSNAEQARRDVMRQASIALLPYYLFCLRSAGFYKIMPDYSVAFCELRCFVVSLCLSIVGVGSRCIVSTCQCSWFHCCDCRWVVGAKRN